MAAVLDTRPPALTFAPSTPLKSGSISPGGFSKSPSLSVDSGIDDVFGSPGSDKSATVVGDTPLKTKNQSGDRDTGCQLVASNPFDNDKTRILFKAVDDLREWDAQDYVEIPQVCSSQRPLSNNSLHSPQLVIVGGQSSGKSSLLRGLTDIPFPVSGGCCTRYPTRIVLHRTKPGMPNSYRISIEKPDISVSGLALLTQDDGDYKREGSVLTEEVFSQVINEVRQPANACVFIFSHFNRLPTGWASKRGENTTAATLSPTSSKSSSSAQSSPLSAFLIFPVSSALPTQLKTRRKRVSGRWLLNT